MYPNVRVVQPTGILDGTQANEFRDAISDSLNAGEKCILVDLQEVTFMDSSGLAALITAVRLVQSAGGKLHICSPNQQIRMLFELTSMDRVFLIFSNQEEFKEKFQQGEC
ncbi:MAG TPA: STAS domain-containing protein [Trichocoleus sp.]|jgi:anti-anti-sigma factor